MSNAFSTPKRQRAAALVVGLVLLLVVTLLAVSGMGTATLELRMAGNTQYRQNAFELAETGIERALAAGDFDSTGPVNVGPVTVTQGTRTIGTFESLTDCTGVTDPPPPPNGMDEIFSLGSSLSATHFTVISTGTSDRGARARHTQGFYVIGPASSIGC